MDPTLHARRLHRYWFGRHGPYEQLAKDKAERDGWVYERIAGNRRLLEILINGDWPPDEFLIVPPGHKIQQDVGENLIRIAAVNHQSDTAGKQTNHTAPQAPELAAPICCSSVNCQLLSAVCCMFSALAPPPFLC